MATVDSLLNPSISQEVDPTFRAARVSLRPIDYQSLQGNTLGHYRAYAETAPITPVAGAILAAFRWPVAINLAVVAAVSIAVAPATAVTLQRVDPIRMTIARAYTTFETVNDVVINLAGNNNKMRTLMSSSGSRISIAATGAGLSGGVRILDANPIDAMAFGPSLNGLTEGASATNVYKWDVLGQHPIVLQTNEGFVITWGATTLATGSIIIGFNVTWAEVPTF